LGWQRSTVFEPVMMSPWTCMHRVGADLHHLARLISLMH
jgi:hypothetical protein